MTRTAVLGSPPDSRLPVLSTIDREVGNPMTTHSLSITSPTALPLPSDFFSRLAERLAAGLQRWARAHAQWLAPSREQQQRRFVIERQLDLAALAAQARAFDARRGL